MTAASLARPSGPISGRREGLLEAITEFRSKLRRVPPSMPSTNVKTVCVWRWRCGYKIV